MQLDQAIIDRLIAACDEGLTDRVAIVRAVRENMPHASAEEIETCVDAVVDCLARAAVEGGRDHAA